MKKFNRQLDIYCKKRIEEFEMIDPERKLKLIALSEYILSKTIENKIVDLTFICTHNSRRSHFGQLWAQTASYWYGIESIRTFSGGTESSALNIRVVNALKRAGFKVHIENADKINPVYLIKQGEDYIANRMYSKTYDHPENPSRDFAAIMVCSDADANCPFVPGADQRFSINYDDPKEYDGTPLEKEKYDERCADIAREMFFVFSNVKKNEI